MNWLVELKTRSNESCELCEVYKENMIAYLLPPKTEEKAENGTYLCSACHTKIVSGDFSDQNYFRFLNASIWSEHDAVQVLSYKLLKKLVNATWAQETLESVYLSDELIAWAEADENAAKQKFVHKDAYGTVLQGGDNVLLIENLNVKGANFIAAKGTKVQKIRLVHENDEQIEGKVNGSTIVILTKYVKKMN